jgi:putative FmdB family regulatory protein
MVRMDLVCSTCKHAFEVAAKTNLMNDEKHCPECGSDRVRQTFGSYLRNGPLLDPKWGCREERSHYG